VLNNNWSDRGICLARAVSMTQNFNPCIQSIIQHPIKVRAPYTTIRDVKIEAIIPFHFPNHYSSRLVYQLFIPDLLVGSFDRALQPGDPWL
jgi:hypothetical protein